MTPGECAAWRATVLLVEDEDELREIVGDLLEQEGYDVIPASNGKQALDYLRDAHEVPAVIILDLMLPILSGWECLRVIHSEERLASVPVLVVTAVGRDRPAGVGLLLKKPFGIFDLLEAVRHLAGGGPPGALPPTGGASHP
jgi:DNA-binding response OmpR family regulator